MQGPVAGRLVPTGALSGGQNRENRWTCQIWSCCAQVTKEIDVTIMFAGSRLPETAENGNADQVKQLLAEGAPVGQANANGFTPLHLASARNHPAVVAVLLNHDAWVPQWTPPITRMVVPHFTVRP